MEIMDIKSHQSINQIKKVFLTVYGQCMATFRDTCPLTRYTYQGDCIFKAILIKLNNSDRDQAN